MNKLLLKNSFREIKSSFGRFAALFAIVAIGVAFFAGLVATAPDMRYSTDAYYDEYNLMDVRILSNVGFTKEDVEAIRDIGSIEGLFATYSVDVVSVNEGRQDTIRIMGMPDDKLTSDNKDYINRLRIKEGRLPQNPGECVVKFQKDQENPPKIGDKIKVESGTDSDISDTLKHREYEVVGIVYTPYYLAFDIGESEVGSGTVDYCMMLQNSEFNSEYYTEIFATVEGAKQLNTYDEKYFSHISETLRKTESLSESRFQVRIDELFAELDKQKEDAIKEAREKVKQSVWDSYYQRYSQYYPGMDVTAMIKDMAEEAGNKAALNFDTATIDAEFSKAKDEVLVKAAEWEWYVLDRDSHYSFRDYESSADKMETIASVFPLFFLLIAALVCLTSMTRMVEEQRELIGTFKALGYRKSSIASKYVIYSLVASLSGGVIGCVVGLKLFPNIIYSCWGIMYDLTPIVYADHTVLSVVAVMSMVAVIEFATLTACYSELSEVPSILMRPKAPKKGKKILLERIRFIWRRMSFSSKVTARNIFRYKRRFFMTVTGVAGGCALMMTGYGIKDSISVLITKQFEEILKYDCSVRYDDDTFLNRFMLDADIKGYVSLFNYSTDVTIPAETVEGEDIEVSNISVNVVGSPDKYAEFVTLRRRNTDIEYKLDDSGVSISEKTAKDLGLKVGDTFPMVGDGGAKAEVKVANIVEMYTGHHIFMTKEYYAERFNETFPDNYVLAKLKDTDSATENRVGMKYLDIDGVDSVTFYSGSVKKFNDMISTINMVTYILILSAAALSFVVLYNLTNVNISERIREIATIKVLGFYNKEVYAYVFRENIVISAIGALAGLGLGVVLHHFIMGTLEFEDIMFGNVIRWQSYVISFAFTMIFSLLVSLFMQKKLKKVPMVESLKSVE